MSKIYRGRNTSAKFLICCILSFQAIPVSLLKSLTAGHRKIIHTATNQLTKTFPPRQNVVEQPRVHLVADSSETVHPHRVRLMESDLNDISEEFQSTHPHGVRLFWNELHRQKIEFQSTHPHGVRLGCTRQTKAHRTVSIHAPTRGATARLPSRFAKESGFNPRTHTGCDLR